MNYFKFKDALIKKDVVNDGYKYTVTVNGQDKSAGSIQGLVNILNEIYKLPKTDILNQLFKDDMKYAGFEPFTYSGQIKAINQVNFIPEYLPLVAVSHLVAGSGKEIPVIPHYTSLQELIDDKWVYAGATGLHCNSGTSNLYVFDQIRYNYKDVYEQSGNYYWHNIHIPGEQTTYKEIVMRTLANPSTTLSRTVGMHQEAGVWSGYTAIKRAVSQTDPMPEWLHLTQSGDDLVHLMEQWDGKIIVWDGQDDVYMPGLNDLHEEPTFIADPDARSQKLGSSQFCYPTQKVYLGKRYKLHLKRIQHIIQLQNNPDRGPIYAAAGVVFAFEPVD